MDKKQQMIIGGVAAVAVIALAIFVFRPKGEATTTTTTDTVSVPGAKPGGDDDSGTSAGGGFSGGASTTAAPAPVGKTGTVNMAKLGGARKDPFHYDWRELPPPPDVFASVEPIRVASATIEIAPEKPVEIRETPSRRVAGIMSGEGVYAILDGGASDFEIVQPGTQTSDGYRVVSITSDSVLLRKQEGNIIRIQTVMFGDAPPNAVARPAGNFGGGFPAGGGTTGFPRAGGGGSKGAEE